jgi:hypothetical protein
MIPFFPSNLPGNASSRRQDSRNVHNPFDAVPAPRVALGMDRRLLKASMGLTTRSSSRRLAEKTANSCHARDVQAYERDQGQNR